MSQLKTLKSIGSSTGGAGSGITGPTGPTGNIGPTGPAGAETGGILGFAYFKGPLYAFAGTARQYCFKNTIANTVMISTTSAPQGSDIQVRLNKNGVALRTFTLPAGSQYIRLTGQAIPLEVDSYLSIDILSVGSAYPGTDLTFQLVI